MTGTRRHVVIDDIPTEYVPFEVGSVRIGTDGRVSVQPADTTARFRFSHDDIRFSALARRGPDCGNLRICGCVGMLPYSAQSAAVRRAALAAMRGAVMDRGRFVVADDQNILVFCELTVPLPLTPARLLAQLTLCLITLKPRVARIRAALAGAPPRNRAEFA